MAEYIDVGPELETDADRRLKEWEAKRSGCPWVLFCDAVYYCTCSGDECEFNGCGFNHWGWR